jgi:Zn-dependent peptidase ImmA (M78 family)
MLEWAVERSGRGLEYLTNRFPGLLTWLAGTQQPTLRQLEEFADATYAPVGYLFLKQPPDEPLPIPDLRTVRDEGIGAPSANLLDTIYQCQIRQDWFKGWAAAQQAESLPFVGSLTVSARIVDAANLMREAVHFAVPASRQFASWSAAVTGLADALSDAGILVMINGVVGTNTSRILDTIEFRGFTLADPIAPLIFVNGADAKAAQLFTLAHECAHLWLGSSGVGNALPGSHDGVEVERWCNGVAAEFLVPLSDLNLTYDPKASFQEELTRLARKYRVSRRVVLSRLFDAGALTWDDYQAKIELEAARTATLEPASSGGNFYATLATRLGKRFLRAVITTTLAGETLYSDAFRMLGIREQRVFDEIPHRVNLA